MKHTTILISGLASALLAVLPAHANDPEHVASKQIFNGEFFQDAPHWTPAASAESDGRLISVKADKNGTIIATPNPVSTDIEDTSSHIMSADYYSDKIVTLEFMQTPGSAADILLMGRYPVRLSMSDNGTADLNSPGAVAPSWDEWNKDNPNRSFGGSAPLKALQLLPNQWHSLSIMFRAPRHDQGHNKIEDALIMSVIINGEQVQRNYVAPAPSQNATFHWEELNGPLSVDAIEGQTALKNVLVARADFSQISMPAKSGEPTNEAQLVNLVDQGKSAFKNYGCAECHSIQKDDKSVKTGPNLYALFTREPRKREVQNQEGHIYEVRADSNYLKRSIRNAEAELAIAETGSKAGSAYLPIMPRYNEQVIPDKDVSAIYSFLLSRNDLWKQGPLVRLEPADGPVEYDPMQDTMQFVVQDRVRMQRGPLPEVSARAIHVGQPNGLHYSFDPRNLSVAKIWQGGFLETSGELTGRGGNGFEMGYQAIELNLGAFGGLIRPYNQAGKLVDFSFKTPKFKDFDTLKASAYSTVPFAERIAEQDAQFKGYFRDSTKPKAPVSFYFNVSGNDLALTHTISPDGKLSIEVTGQVNKTQRFAVNTEFMKALQVSVGTLTDGIWELPASPNLKASLTAVINTIDTPWQAPLLDFNYEKQAFEKAAAKAELPPGYSIEDWYAPKDNVGREQLFEAIGLDPLKNGDVIVSTRTAGVWKKTNDSWQLFAEGIFDSLGVLSESDDGSVAVVGNKAELTRIRDINGDGIADYYETLFDAFTNGGNYHTYTHGPVKDADGNYVLTLNLGVGEGVYYTAGGNVMGSHGGYVGWAVRVTPQGEYEYFANGLRSPAGLGADLSGQPWYADNQGDFVGSSKIFMLEDDKFYGHPAGLIDEPGMTPDSKEVTWPEVIKRKEKAVIVVAHGKVANSLGNPVWDSTDGAFGPYQGQMFIGDQTQSNLSRVVYEKVNGQWQGAMIPFAKGMESGVMRPVFLPDNSMLLGQTGRGWHAKGGNAAALQRITYNAQSTPLHIKDVNITQNGFTLSFTRPLPDSLSDETLLESLRVNSWTYRDAPDYGSEEMGLADNPVASVSVNRTQNQLTLTLANPVIPAVHPEQTARIFHIALTNEELQELSGTQSLNAYYSAHEFKK
ncbi:family 16 glycoside hydrolase [Glaciecola siphonariae]|uniref:Family 16 glycoside hydrolase n=1 Tax=Glaciecola siphonariae TaxID=521012 RepID=A0ABV9LYG7_9ALTE